MADERKIMEALLKCVYNTGSYRSTACAGTIHRIIRMADDPFPPVKPKKGTVYWDGDKLVVWDGEAFDDKINLP